MSEPPVFKITYWGITGTFSDALRPQEVTDKLCAALRLLVETGRLQELRPGPDLDAGIRELVEAELPFHLRSTYGGNTTCIEVQTPDALIILDCGSGFRELGHALATRWDAEGPTARRTAHVLLSHGHMDHTFATPYFDPYYDPANAFTLCGAQATLDSLTAVLNPESLLSRVFFPPTFEQMAGLRGLQPLQAGIEFQIGSTRVTTHALNHPGGSLAFRLENAGRSFVFATDHEQSAVPDPGLVAFAADADLFYTEGQYTQEEYDGKIGVPPGPPMLRHRWGHTPLTACVATAVAARARRLHIGHRDPNRSDLAVTQFGEHLQQLVAAELQRLDLPTGSMRALIPFEGMTISL